MNLTRQDWIKILIGAAVSLLALAAILYFIEPAQLLAALSGADARFLVLLFGTTLVWLLLRAVVWRTLLQEQAPYGEVFLTLNEGYLLNNVLPLRLGEVGRAFLLSRKAGLGFLQVFSTVVIERALDLGFAAGLLLATLPFVVGAPVAREIALAAGAVVVAGLLGLYLLARNRAWALRQYAAIVARLPRLGRMIGRRQVESLFDGLGALVDFRRFVRVLLLVALNWGVALVQFFFLVRAFLPEAQPLWAGFVLAVMAMGVAAPSSPGAIGVLEGSVILALSAFGIDPSTGLAVGLTAHVANYAMTGVIGAYALARDGLSLGGVFQAVRQASPVDESVRGASTAEPQGHEEDALQS